MPLESCCAGDNFCSSRILKFLHKLQHILHNPLGRCMVHSLAYSIYSAGWHTYIDVHGYVQGENSIFFFAGAFFLNSLYTYIRAILKRESDKIRGYWIFSRENNVSYKGGGGYGTKVKQEVFYISYRKYIRTIVSRDPKNFWNNVFFLIHF